MIAFAALLLVPTTPWVLVDEQGSKAAVQIFKEACTQGALKLPPSRGRIIAPGERTSFSQVLPRFRATVQETVIEFSYPRGTFLIFADYKDVQPKGIGRDCVLVSRVLSIQDALAAIMETAPDKDPERKWIPNMYLNAWAIDVPERGFLASATVRSDRSVLIALSMYRSALDNAANERQAR